MNETINNFLKSLNIDIDNFNSLEESKIKEAVEINPILSRFKMFKKNETKNVSIADIVGYDYSRMNLGKGLLDNLSEFFDKDGDSYHRRSVSMLEIPQNKIIDELENSFKREPICLAEVDGGVYNIDSNGLHRFHIIRTHYLDELSKLNSNDKNALKRLREKYSFPANVFEVDFIKSYSAFLLKYFDNNLSIELHYNSNFEITGKSRLVNYSNPEEKVILTDEQLVELVHKKMNQFLKNAPKGEKQQFNEFLKKAFKFDSFKNYYDEVFNKNQKGECEWN